MTSPSALPKPSRRLVTAALAIVALVLLVYVPGALRNRFAIDDARFIHENRRVLFPEGWDGWLSFFYDPRTVDPVTPGNIVRPLRTLEFALDHQLFGLSTTAFHLHTILWHVVASVLVLLLLERLVVRLGPAFVGAAVWALHPMQVEAVAWISSRGDAAMGACVIGALLLELGSRGRDRSLAGALVLGAVAMLYKETAVVLPLLVFALRLARPRTGAPGSIVPAVRAAVPYALLTGIYLVYRFGIEVRSLSHANTFVLGASTAGTFSTMFRAIGAYIVMSVLPVRSDFDWYLNPSTSLLEPGALAWLAVLAALVFVAVRLRSRQPLVSAGISVFLFALIPVSNWPFQLGIPTAERFLYLSLLGLALCIACAAARSRRVVTATAVAALAMGVISSVRTRDWLDDEVLMGSALHHDTSPRAYAWFAATEREKAVEIDSRASRAEDPAEKERLRAEARAGFEKALDLAHRSLTLWHRFEKVSHSISGVVVNPHINAGNSALFLERFGEAVWHSERALAANDWLFPQPYYNRAMALLPLGRPAEAVDSLEQALKIGASVDGSVIRCALRSGRACADAGAFDAARRAYRLIQQDRPEIASRGLAEVDDAERALFASPPSPQDAAVRLAAVGAEVPAPLVRSLPEGSRLDFVLGCAAERAGDDQAAGELLRRAVAAGGLPDFALERARLSIERIETGCPAWQDQGVPPLPE